jgi:DNA modification methylase
LEELSASNEIDISSTGFDLPEISEIIDRVQDDAKEDSFDLEEAVGAGAESITKPGEIIELGAHRLACGDSADGYILEKLLGENKVSLLHTDPPYNVDYYGGSRPNAQARPANNKLWERIYADNLSQDKYEEMLRAIFTNASKFMLAGAPIYIWNGHRQFGPMHLMLTALDFHVSCVITWAKESFALGYGDYNQQTEFCLYGWKNGKNHFWNGPNNESTLWQIKRDPKASYQHPTQKALAIPKRAIRNSSKRGDIVLDLFLGSGSTLIAAESLNRRCFGIEIDPKYCDVIVRRYIAFVGEDKVPELLRVKYQKED